MIKWIKEHFNLCFTFCVGVALINIGVAVFGKNMIHVLAIQGIALGVLLVIGCVIWFLDGFDGYL